MEGSGAKMIMPIHTEHQDMFGTLINNYKNRTSNTILLTQIRRNNDHQNISEIIVDDIGNMMEIMDLKYIRETQKVPSLEAQR